MPTLQKIVNKTICQPTMPKLIAAINTTLDGVCDHTAGVPDEEIHQ